MIHSKYTDKSTLCTISCKANNITRVIKLLNLLHIIHYGSTVCTILCPYIIEAVQSPAYDLIVTLMASVLNPAIIYID